MPINIEKQSLQRIVEILKLALTLGDEEILKSSVESVIDLLEDEISKPNQ